MRPGGIERDCANDIVSHGSSANQEHWALGVLDHCAGDRAYWSPGQASVPGTSNHHGRSPAGRGDQLGDRVARDGLVTDHNIAGALQVVTRFHPSVRSAEEDDFTLPQLGFGERELNRHG
jgi:hypothetical protein